jgi:hypothetical protein
MTGNFFRAGLPEGPVTIDISAAISGIAACIAPAPLTVQVVGGGTTSADIVVTCPGTGIVQGVVLDLDGIPVAGAFVDLADAPETVTPSFSAADGYYSLTVLAVPHVLTATKQDCFAPPQPPIFPSDGGALNVNLSISCRGIISGTVTSSLTGPLAGVEISFSEPGPAGQLFQGPTDAAGHFRFQEDGVWQVGIALIHVPAGCAQPPSQTVTVRQQGDYTVDFPLTCGAVVLNEEPFDFTADAAARDLLGGATLSDSQRVYLDRHGNQDGSYDLGDLLAFLDHTHTTVAPGLLGTTPRSKEHAP